MQCPTEGPTLDLMRWNDDRLDDLAEQVRRNADVREQLAELRAELGNVGEDATACISELKELKSNQEATAKAQHIERVSDRRWMIGTLIATAALVITALGIFLG